MSDDEHPGPPDGDGAGEGEPEVRAGGGLILRVAPDGGVELLLVHRPRYDDWSFPKGKVDPGETDEECARREVEEETGLRCRLVRDLGWVRYTDHKGRDKVVRYWEMAVEDGAFAPNDEVDEVRWLTPRAASATLSYDYDVDFLARTLG